MVLLLHSTSWFWFPLVCFIRTKQSPIASGKKTNSFYFSPKSENCNIDLHLLYNTFSHFLHSEVGQMRNTRCLRHSFILAQHFENFIIKVFCIKESMRKWTQNTTINEVIWSPLHHALQRQRTLQEQLHHSEWCKVQRYFELFQLPH